MFDGNKVVEIAIEVCDEFFQRIGTFPFCEMADLSLASVLPKILLFVVQPTTTIPLLSEMDTFQVQVGSSAQVTVHYCRDCTV